MDPFYITTSHNENEIRGQLHRDCDRFLDLWRNETGLAIAGIDLPAAQTDPSYAWCALLGNMIWATSACLTDGATVILGLTGEQAVAFLGAGIVSASGIAQSNHAPSANPLSSLKEELQTQISTIRRDMNYFTNNIVDMAFNTAVTDRGLIGNDLATIESRNRIIWNILFKRNINYLQQNVILNQARQMINRIITQIQIEIPLYDTEINRRLVTAVNVRHRVARSHRTTFEQFVVDIGRMDDGTWYLDDEEYRREEQLQRHLYNFYAWLSFRNFYQNLDSDSGLQV